MTGATSCGASRETPRFTAPPGVPAPEPSEIVVVNWAVADGVVVTIRKRRIAEISSLTKRLR